MVLTANFRKDAARLAVPVYLMEGRFEAPGTAGPSQGVVRPARRPH